MAEENVILEFVLKEIYGIRKHFIEEIKQNELISEEQKNVCKILF